MFSFQLFTRASALAVVSAIIVRRIKPAAMLTFALSATSLSSHAAVLEWQLSGFADIRTSCSYYYSDECFSTDASPMSGTLIIDTSASQPVTDFMITTEHGSAFYNYEEPPMSFSGMTYYPREGLAYYSSPTHLGLNDNYNSRVFSILFANEITQSSSTTIAFSASELETAWKTWGREFHGTATLVSAVPLPAAFPMLTSGLIGLAFCGFRRGLV